MAINHLFDTPVGLVVAGTLHTLGAIGVVAGLVVHITWYRKLRLGIESDALRTVFFFIAINATAANLVGGFMRTFLPAHPGLADIAVSPWVQVMVLKHLFVFAALGALLWMYFRTQPGLLARHRAGTLGPRTPTEHAILSWVVATGVIGSTVLGTMAAITSLGPGFDDDPDDHDDHDLELRHSLYHNATGTLTSLPPAFPGESTGTFFIPADRVLLQATLQWSNPVAGLSLCLGPVGGEEECVAGGDRATMTIELPDPGDWRYRVTGSNAIAVAWDLSLRMAAAMDDEVLLAETVTVPPGSFFEINTVMEEGATFHWDWSASAAVHFDVHSHFDGEVQYYVELTATEHRGSFTNDREGGYSLLWANEGGMPVTLTYRVWGEFEVHSYFPPR